MTPPAAVAAGDIAPVTPAAPTVDAGTPLDEAVARAQLARLFRAAGLRVRYDVVRTGPGYSLTVDGLDPARGIGFEYVAVEERGTDLEPAEQRALAASGEAILVIEATDDAAAIEARAADFLSRYALRDGGTGS